MQSKSRPAIISANGDVIVRADIWGEIQTFHIDPGNVVGDTVEEIEASMKQDILAQLVECAGIEVPPAAVHAMFRLKRQSAAQ